MYLKKFSYLISNKKKKIIFVKHTKDYHSYNILNFDNNILLHKHIQLSFIYIYI